MSIFDAGTRLGTNWAHNPRTGAFTSTNENVDSYECGNAEPHSGRVVALGVLARARWVARDIAKFVGATTLDEVIAAFSRKSKKREHWAGKFARLLLQRRSSNAANDNLIGALDGKEDDGKEDEDEKRQKNGKKENNTK